MRTPPQDWPERSRELSGLLARSALGDRDAFATLYERTSAHLFAVVLRIQRDRAVAEDLLQEIYVSVWKAARGFDAAQSQPLTWLTSIARNRAIDSLRRAQVQPQTQSLTRDDDDDAPDPTEALADAAPGPLELLDRAGAARELTRCMEVLSAQQRQSVALAFFDGLSHAEVAVPRWWQRLAVWRGVSAVATAAALALAVALVVPPAAQPPVVVVLQGTGGAAQGINTFVASVSADGRALVTKPLMNVSLEANRVLELWSVPPQGAPRSLGLISASGATVVPRGKLPEALLKGGTAALAVSLEPPGGSPTGVPTGPVLYAGKLQL